jgi:hypothetical protein
LEGWRLATDAQKRAKARYDKTTKAIVLRLRRGADADIIERLESVPQKTEYLRRLIRHDIQDNPNI